MRPVGGRTGGLVRATAVLATLALSGVLPVPRADAAWELDQPPREVPVVGRATDQGTPVAGVRVTITSLRWLRGWEWETVTRTATTGTDGRYRLDDVPVPSVVRDGSTGNRGVAELVAEKDPIDPYRRDLFDRLRASVGTEPVTVDLPLVHRSATVRGRVSVRGATVGPATVTAVSAGAEPQRFSVDADGDGRYALRLPTGSWQLEAESRFGLPTRWPDLPSVRTDAPAIDLAPEEARDHVDFSLRARLPGPGYDQYGEWYTGWDPAHADDNAVAYPPDVHRSSYTPSDARLTLVGAPRNDPRLIRPAPDGELLTSGVAGGAFVLPIQLEVRNDGGDVAVLRRVDVVGDPLAVLWCTTDAGVSCDARERILPGGSSTISLGVVFSRYALNYRVAIGIPGTEVGAIVRLRNVAPPGWPANGDLRLPADLAERATPELLAAWRVSGSERAPSARVAAASASASASAPRRPSVSATATSGRPAAAPASSTPRRLAAPTLSRTHIVARFPGAGRATVRIDRRIAPAGHDGRPARWRTLGRVTLRARQAGTVRVRVPRRRLAAGIYRMRVQAWIAGAPLDARTAIVRVRR